MPYTAERKAEMKAKSGKTDLPQIFINDKYIGVRASVAPQAFRIH